MKHAADITAFINALRAVTGVGVCYYDLKDFFNYFQAGVRNNCGHYCDFCRAVRELPGGKRPCEKSDKIEAVSLAAQYRQPFFFECHMGMQELVLPLLHRDSLVGIVFIGQCRIRGESPEKTIAQRVQEQGGDPAHFLELYAQLPELRREDLRAAGQILSQYFQLRMENSQPLGQAAVYAGASLAEQVYSYIQLHFCDNLSTKSLAEHFFVTQAHLSRAFRTRYGLTVTTHIRNLRMEYAQRLLSQTNASVSSIALNVGYPDVNYFSRVFHGCVGMTPTQYRAGKAEAGEI